MALPICSLPRAILCQGGQRLWGETAFRHQLLAGLCIVAILILIGAGMLHIVHVHHIGRAHDCGRSAQHGD